MSGGARDETSTQLEICQMDCDLCSCSLSRSPSLFQWHSRSSAPALKREGGRQSLDGRDDKEGRANGRRMAWMAREATEDGVERAFACLASSDDGDHRLIACIDPVISRRD